MKEKYSLKGQGSKCKGIRWKWKTNLANFSVSFKAETNARSKENRG